VKLKLKVEGRYKKMIYPTLLENIIFSEKTLLLDKSNLKKNNLLIIVGISGSGKTTLGKKNS